jgi:hypothetical protein
MRARRWSDHDHYMGPFTYAHDRRGYRPLALVLSSADLVSLGLFRGPYGVDANGDTPGWCGAFYYLTEDGKQLARALIGARETKARALAPVRGTE